MKKDEKISVSIKIPNIYFFLFSCMTDLGWKIDDCVVSNRKLDLPTWQPSKK